MGRDQCSACGETVQIAGGITGLWQQDHEPTGGMTLEFTDGSVHFLCFDCIDELPDNPKTGDVDALASEGAD